MFISVPVEIINICKCSSIRALMENASDSSKKKEKKGLLTKAVERCRSFGTGWTSSETKIYQPKSNLSSPRPAFPNRSKSISCHGSTKQTEKKKLFFKTLQRSRSLSSWYHDMRIQSKFNLTSPVPSFAHRLKSVGRASSFQVVPGGCFTVCVGPKKERFVVKMACLNHPFFQALLQQAENELGFTSNGPLMLPCDIEIFREVMLEMEQQSSPDNLPGCNFSRSPYRYGRINLYRHS